MGNRITNMMELYNNPEDHPRYCHKPVYDPLLGFGDKGRPKREMIATPEEMESAKLPKDKRNYCAHKAIEYLTCRRQNLLFHKYKCAHEHHEYAMCEYDDWIIRMKDYERERRLAIRARRLKAAEGA